MKYIIKNCPALSFPLKDNPECIADPIYPCKDIKDCLLKQIAEKCNQIPKIVDGNPEKLPTFELGVEFRNKTILDLLNIEECEDE